MDSLIKKTGLGIAVQSAITQLSLEESESKLFTIFNEVFLQKFQEFKKIHNPNFPSITVKGNYLIDNQFPIGENDKQQYFRCLAHDVKIGNNSLAFEVNDQKRRFTVIEGYSRNDDNKKRSYNRSHALKKGSSKSKSRCVSGRKQQKK